jgi:hypothetical protein
MAHALGLFLGQAQDAPGALREAFEFIGHGISSLPSTSTTAGENAGKECSGLILSKIPKPGAYLFWGGTVRIHYESPARAYAVGSTPGAAACARSVSD